MSNITTKFINNTSVKSLRNPFETVSPDRYSSLPDYLKSLSEELLHYNAHIKSTAKFTIDGDHVDIVIEFTGI